MSPNAKSCGPVVQRADKPIAFCAINHPALLSLTTASILCAALYLPDAHAQTSVNPAIRELDLQKKLRQQEDINRELESNRRGSAVQQAPMPDAIPDELPADTGPKFLINKITVDAGEHPGLAVKVADILATYENRELGSNDLFGLIRDVTNRYADRGYSTTTVSLLPKNMKQGSVELKVNWGYVEGWLVNGAPADGAYKKLIAAFAMPGVGGKPLNIHQVDQMVENLNNSAKTARIDIQPSSRAGFSFLNLVTEDKPQPSLTLRADNSGMGSPSNGRYRFSASTSLSDLVLGNDTLGLNLSSRRYQLSDSHSEYNGGLSYSVPFGYSKVDLRFNHSQYERYQLGNYGGYVSEGDSQTFSAKFSHVLMREKTEKLSASVELEHKKSANYVAEKFIAVNSLPFTSLGAGLEHVTQLLGGSLYSDATFSQGISTWEGAQAAYDKNKQRRHFQKVEFNTAWSRPIEWLNQNFNFSSRIGGQYAKYNMMTAEQIGIGDEFTVRGFRGPALWGDQGIYISNTLSLPFRAVGATLTPSIGLDSGYVRDVAYAEKNGGITGLALGMSAGWSYGGGAVTVGLPLTMDKAIRDSTDGSALYLSTYLNF